MKKNTPVFLLKKKKAFFSIGIFLIFLFSGGQQALAQEYESLEIASGFNEDVIAETSPADETTTSPVDGTSAGANFAFMSKNYPGATVGLPANRIINSQTTEGLTFKLADYSENNSLRFSSNNQTATLEIANPVSAKKIFILATSGSGNSNFSGTIHFSDNSTQTINTLNVPDWFNNNTNVAISGIGRVSRVNGNVENNANDPRLYQIEIVIEEENQEKEISEINFTKIGIDGYLNIFGISREFEPDCAKPENFSVEDIAANSANLSWSAGPSEETSWKFIYGEEGFDLNDEGTTVAVQENSYLLEDLLPNTVYEVYIQALCSDTEESNFSGPHSFTTACDAVDIPYLQDFENASPPAIPNCSEIESISGGQNWATTNQDLYNMPAGFNGQVLYYHYTSFGAGNANAWYFTEGINLEADTNYQISYKYGNNSPSYTEKLKVAFGTSQTASAMVNELADYPNISDHQMHEEEINFTVDEDGVYYFRFQAYSDANQYYLIIDDIQVDLAPNCLKPTDINADNITSNEANISWTAGDQEEQWELVYGIAQTNFDPDTDGTSLLIEDNAEVLLENLAVNTNYLVYVKSICSENEQSDWSSAYSFTTACGTMEIPYFEDFESASVPDIPQCGSLETNSGNSWTTTSVASGYDGNVLNYSYHLSQDADTWFFTPPINMEADKTYQISYKYGNSGSWEEKLKVAFGTSNNSDAMENEIANHPNIIGTFNNEVILTVPTDGVYYFGFQAYSDANKNQLYLDDIEIIEAAACLPPQELNITSSDSSAEVSWTPMGSENSWELIYGENGFNPETEGTSIIVEDQPEATLENLSPGTSYEVYIRAICEDEESLWSDSADFSTACEIATIPFLEDFENVIPPEIPLCGSTENAGSGNNWETYDPEAPGNYVSANGFDGIVLMYEYDLNQSANAWYFTQGIQLEAGINYQISYKYGNGSGSGAQEKLKVKMGTSASSSTMDIELADHPDISNIDAETHSLIFTVENDDVYYFGFQAYSDANKFFLFLDDIEIDFGPTCPAPTQLENGLIGDTWAEISWTSGQENTAWKIIYGETGFDPKTEGESFETQETSALISGLDVNTNYEVYIKAICEEETGELSQSIVFTTATTPPQNNYLCNAIELFANDTCAEGLFTNENAFPQINEPAGSCLNNFRGDNSVWFFFVATNEVATITTDFDSTDFTTEIVVFEAPTDCEDMDLLGSEVSCAGSGEEVSLNNLNVGDTYYIKVAGFNNTSGNFCIEIHMEEAACPAPTDIIFDNIEEYSVEISWIAGGEETHWEILYGLAGFDPETEGESVIILDNPFLELTDLEDNTDYDVYIRALCDEDLKSEWAGPETFSTKELDVDSFNRENFSFYPNPTFGKLNFTSNEQIENIQIFNFIGQKVLELNPQKIKPQLDLDHLQSGVYLMKVKIDGSSKSFKVIKK